MKVSVLFLAGVALGTASFAQTEMQNDTSELRPDASACSAGLDQGCAAALGTFEPVTDHARATFQDHATADQQNDMTGMGGPLDERTGYPPCDPGPGDDSCIQLYEHGVSGTGN